MSLRRKYIDGAEVFRIYFEEMGSAHSLMVLSKKFPINSRTEVRVTQDGGYKAMWRWACRPENEEISYKIFKKSSYGQDPEWTKARWHEELKEKARWAVTPSQFKKWYSSRKVEG